MSFQEVLYEIDGHVATVTLNRPGKLNAWTLRMSQEVREAMRRAADDNAIRVIVFTGAGRGFCAGGDMELLDNIKTDSERHAPKVPPAFNPRGPVDFHGPDSYFPSIDKPIICALNGVAAGIGLVYTLYCDIRFAGSDAYVFTAFAQRGAIAEHGMSWLLPRVVGLPTAFDLLYSARRVGAEEALRLGLVNRVFPQADLLMETKAYAQMLATQMSPRSLQVMKRQLWDDQSRSLGQSVAVAQAEMALSFLSEDFREGIAHFRERRAPAFTGR